MGASPILSAADLATMRELHEDSLPHAGRILVPTLVRQPGGVTIETYPNVDDVARVACRLQRATADVIARMSAEQLQARPLSIVAFAVDDVDESALPLKAHVVVDGETNDSAWTVTLEVIGVEPHRSYQSQRRALCVPVKL